MTQQASGPFTHAMCDLCLKSSRVIFSFQLQDSSSRDKCTRHWVDYKEIWVIFEVKKDKPPSCLPLVLPSKQPLETLLQRFIFWIMHWPNPSEKGQVEDHLGLLVHKAFAATSQFCICSMKALIVVYPQCIHYSKIIKSARDHIWPMGYSLSVPTLIVLKFLLFIPLRDRGERRKVYGVR